MYVKPKVCNVCNATFLERMKYKRHKDMCVSDQNTSSDISMIQQLKQQVSTLQKQNSTLQKQITEKDKFIQELTRNNHDLTKRIGCNNNNNNNNTYIQIQNKNVYGQESVDHISEKTIQELVKRPCTAIPEYIRLKHKRHADNDNIRCPNKKIASYKIIVDNNGKKEWESRPKQEVLDDLLEKSMLELETTARDSEAPEGGLFGNTKYFDNFQTFEDKVTSDEKEKRLQLNSIHNVFI